MKYTNEQLKEFCVNRPKLVARKESKRYPGLFVLKYARRVFYDRLFSTYPILEELRGLVVDADFNVISKPFTKIYNFLEEGAGSNLTDDSLVNSTRKVNGFMATVKQYRGELLVSTTGSLDSDFVDMALEYLGGIEPHTLDPDFSYMFEICHPNDPHIVPEKSGAYFLAMVAQDDGTTLYSYNFKNQEDVRDLTRGFPDSINIDEWLNPRPTMRFGDLKAEVKACEHEGFVITPVDDPTATFKWKSPYYLVLKMFARKADILTLQKDRVEEEYFKLVKYIRQNATEFNALPEQDRLQYMREFLENNEVF